MTANLDKKLLLADVQDRIDEWLPAKQSRRVITDVDDALSGYAVKQIADPFADESETMQYITQFLTSKEMEGRSPKTIKHYKYVLERLYKDTGVPFKKLTSFQLQAYMASEKKRGVSMVTIKSNLHVYRSFYRWMRNNVGLIVAPTDALEVIKAKSDPEDPFSELDIYLIKQCLKTPLEKAVVYFLLSTGCRISEVCSVNRDDIDWSGMKLDVIGKGNKKRRVYLDPVTIVNLREYLATRKDDDEALFYSRLHNRFDPGGIRIMLKRIEKRCGVENIHPHRFRHTLATNLADHGMSIQEIAVILGHANLDTTMIYVKVNQRNVENSYRKYACM